MDLEASIAELRPRGPWEAVDFGWRLAQHLWRQVYGAWFLVMTPLAIAAIAANWTRPWIAVGMFLLLRPALHPVLLWVLSRGLFGGDASVKQLLPELRRVLLKDFLPRILWRRLQPMHSYTLPVSMLEGLKGAKRRKRIQLLSRKLGSRASELMLLCWCMELVVLFGGMALVFLLLPEALHPDWERFFDLYLWEVPGWGRIVFLLVVASTTLAQPLYVAGGFGLYLTRRTVLEGWDVQLAFSGLARRTKELTAGVLALLVALVGIGVMPSPAHAQDGWEGDGYEFGGSAEDEEATPAPMRPIQPPSTVLSPEERDVDEEIEEILDHEDFGGEETRMVWRTRNPTEESTADLGFLGAFAAQLGEIALWIVMIVAIGVLMAWIVRAGRIVSVPQRDDGIAPPTELFGLDLRPESLPDDVAATARRLLDSGDRIGALSLLYRGALVRLVHGFALELPDGATENDCVRAVRAVGGPSRWFEGLTGAWQSEAYAHREVAEGVVTELIDGWAGSVGGIEVAP